jgi:hypothetical protein
MWMLNLKHHSVAKGLCTKCLLLFEKFDQSKSTLSVWAINVLDDKSILDLGGCAEAAEEEADAGAGLGADIQVGVAGVVPEACVGQPRLSKHLLTLDTSCPFSKHNWHVVFY